MKVAVLNTKVASRESIARIRRCGVDVVVGADYDADILLVRKVILTNSKGIYDTTVGEHAVAMMLALNRGLKSAILYQEKKEWKVFEHADELFGKTVGIVGAGLDEKALIDSLKNSRMGGAGLDVFENEPLPKSSKLWKMKNVIITAHYAGYTPYHEERAVELFCKNLEAFMKGKKMQNVIDKNKGY